MGKKKKLGCVVFCYQPGKAVFNYDSDFFSGVTVPKIQKLLSCKTINGPIIVIINGDKESSLSEKSFLSRTPTALSIESKFKNEVAAGKIIPYICKAWNSDTTYSFYALNIADNVAKEHGAAFVLHWNMNVDINGMDSAIKLGLKNMIQNNLSIVGFRKSEESNLSNSIPNNNFCIWRLESLSGIGGFNPRDTSIALSSNKIANDVEKIGTNNELQDAFLGFLTIHTILRMLRFDAMCDMPSFRGLSIKFAYGIVSDIDISHDYFVDDQTALEAFQLFVQEVYRNVYTSSLSELYTEIMRKLKERCILISSSGDLVSKKADKKAKKQGAGLLKKSAELLSEPENTAAETTAETNLNTEETSAETDQAGEDTKAENTPNSEEISADTNFNDVDAIIAQNEKEFEEMEKAEQEKLKNLSPEEKAKRENEEKVYDFLEDQIRQQEEADSKLS